MGDFVGDQTGASGVSRTGAKLPAWWASLTRLDPTLPAPLVASILAWQDSRLVPAATVATRARTFNVAAQSRPLVVKAQAP